MNIFKIIIFEFFYVLFVMAILFIIMVKISISDFGINDTLETSVRKQNVGLVVGDGGG